MINYLFPILSENHELIKVKCKNLTCEKYYKLTEEMIGKRLDTK